MQIVHILRTKKEPIPELRFKFRKGEMRRIGTRLRSLFASLRIELPHQFRILLQRLRRAHIFHAMSRPQSI